MAVIKGVISREVLAWLGQLLDGRHQWIDRRNHLDSDLCSFRQNCAARKNHHSIFDFSGDTHMQSLGCFPLKSKVASALIGNYVKVFRKLKMAQYTIRGFTPALTSPVGTVSSFWSRV